MEQYKNTSLHQVQLSLITRQERKEGIFKMAFAFEDFALKYSQYHLNESVPQLNIANNKLGRWKYFDSYHSNLGKRCIIIYPRRALLRIRPQEKDATILYYILQFFSDNRSIQTFITTVLKFLVKLAIFQS